jgi:transposase
MIHEYVSLNAHRLHAWKPMDARLAELRELVRQRQSVADDLARMRQTYKALNMPAQLMNEMLAGLLKAKKHLDKRIAQALSEIPQAKSLMSIKGVGQLIAATLLVPLMHFEFKGVDSFVGFIGIDPVPNDSGLSNAKRSISKKGDPYLRRACFMAALCACRHEPWKQRYEAFKAKGHKPKQALIAVAKKIAITAFHLFHKQLEFDPKMLARP